VPRPGIDLKAKWNREALFGCFGRTGTHTPEGAFFFDSHGSRPERLRDVGVEVLRWFQCQSTL
jgi:hypothetical protein